MREERKRKALYVNRREDLYASELLKKERSPGAPGKTSKRRAKKAPSAARPSGSKTAR
jgi:hypothetical protein